MTRITPAPVFSNYPVAKVDIALIMDVDVPCATLTKTLREGAGELLETIKLFDLYAGEQIGADKKSLAFALRLRAPDRTLTAQEISTVSNHAVALALARHGAVLR